MVNGLFSRRDRFLIEQFVEPTEKMVALHFKVFCHAVAAICCCCIFSYSRDELLAMNVRDLAVPEETRVEERLRRLQAGESLQFETIHRRRDGTRFELEVVAAPARLKSESYVIAFCRDITER